MKISREEVLKVAHLARMELEESEAERLTGDMNNILGYIDKLAELDTKNVEPTSHAVPVKNVFRDDERRESLNVDEGLANAPDSAEGSFKVPKVIE